MKKTLLTIGAISLMGCNPVKPPEPVTSIEGTIQIQELPKNSLVTVVLLWEEAVGLKDTVEGGYWGFYDLEPTERPTAFLKIYVDGVYKWGMTTNGDLDITRTYYDEPLEEE